MKLFGMTEPPTAHARYSLHTSDAVTLVCIQQWTLKYSIKLCKLVKADKYFVILIISIY